MACDFKPVMANGNITLPQLISQFTLTLNKQYFNDELYKIKYIAINIGYIPNIMDYILYKNKRKQNLKQSFTTPINDIEV